MTRETKLRSVLKTVSWRFIATATTFSLVYLFTGKLDMAFAVGGIEVALKMLFYFLHERGWDGLKWGRKEVRPFVVWITGLSGSGKTTIARLLCEKLEKAGLKTEHLDGETIRELFPETGFTPNEVNEHVKRVGHLASRLENRGVFVVASFISPYRESREFVRKLCGQFIEVHLSTPVEVCERRDRKGLYQKAKQGKIRYLPGVDVTYEPSHDHELEIDTSLQSMDESVNAIFKHLQEQVINT